MSKFKYGTTMLLKDNTKDRLDKQYGVKGDSYDGILNKIIDKAEKYNRLLAMPEFKKFCEKYEIEL